MESPATSSENYKILLAAFLANFVGTGIGFYGFGVFFKPLAEYFGYGRAGIGIGIGLSLIVGALWAPRVGKAADKWGPKPLLMFGSLAVALVLILMSIMQSYWQFLLLYGIFFSLANLHLGDIVTGSTIAKNFPYNTGRALGLATVGVSFGGVIMPPVVQAVINVSDWRCGLKVLSIFPLLLVTIPSIFIFRNSFTNQKNTSENTVDTQPETPSLTRREAFRSPAFWKMVALFSLSFFPLGTMLVQQIPFLTDMGISPTNAAWVLSLTAVMGMAGKVFWGIVFDKIEGRYAVSIAIGIQAFAVLWVLQANALWEAIIFGLLYGFGMGGLVPLHTAMRSRQFGSRHIGAIMGISSPFIMLAQAGGQPFSGWVFDTTGTYRTAFIIFVGCYLTAIAIALTLRDPQKAILQE